MKVGFIYCEFLLVGDENNTELQQFESVCDAAAKKLPHIYVRVLCISEVFTNEQQ